MVCHLNRRDRGGRNQSWNAKKASSLPDELHFAGGTFLLCNVGEPFILRRMTRQQMLDLYFMEARAKLIDIAAFLDRVERSEGEADFRMTGFTKALKTLGTEKSQRARNVLLALSDPTTEPIPAATTKAACGAWPGTK